MAVQAILQMRLPEGKFRNVIKTRVAKSFWQVFQVFKFHQVFEIIQFWVYFYLKLSVK